jgi:predicted PurR-regulated permease PerM
MAKRTRVSSLLKAGKVSFLNKRTDWKKKYLDAEEQHKNDLNKWKSATKELSDGWEILTKKLLRQLKRQMVMMTIMAVCFLALFLCFLILADSYKVNERALDYSQSVVHKQMGIINSEHRLILEKDIQINDLIERLNRKEIEILQSDNPPQIIFGCNDSGVVGVN